MKESKSYMVATMISIMLVVMMMSCVNGKRKQTKHKVNQNCVYVCTGTNAKRYHSVDICQGLSKCSDMIIEMTVTEARDEGKTSCRMCIE